MESVYAARRGSPTPPGELPRLVEEGDGLRIVAAVAVHRAQVGPGLRPHGGEPVREAEASVSHSSARS